MKVLAVMQHNNDESVLLFLLDQYLTSYICTDFFGCASSPLANLLQCCFSNIVGLISQLLTNTTCRMGRSP